MALTYPIQRLQQERDYEVIKAQSEKKEDPTPSHGPSKKVRNSNHYEYPPHTSTSPPHTLLPPPPFQYGHIIFVLLK